MSLEHTLLIILRIFLMNKLQTLFTVLLNLHKFFL